MIFFIAPQDALPVYVSFVIRPLDNYPKTFHPPFHVKGRFVLKSPSLMDKAKQRNYTIDEVWSDPAVAMSKTWQVPAYFLPQYLHQKEGAALRITPLKITFTDSKGKRMLLYGSTDEGPFTRSNRVLKGINYVVTMEYDSKEDLHMEENVATVVE